METLPVFGDYLTRLADDALPLLVDSVVKGALILTLAFAITAAMSRASAAARHMVWGLSLAGLLLLPVLSAVVPEWSVPGLDRAVAQPMLDAGPAPVRSQTAAEVSPIGKKGMAPTVSNHGKPNGTHGVTLSSAAAAVPMQESGSVSGAEALRFHLDAGAWMLLIWLTGFVAVLVTTAAGLVNVWRLSHSAEPVEGPLARLVDDLVHELQLGRPVTVLVSSEHAMPMTWGIKPKVLLPADAGDWTDERLRAVLLHELAHVKRWDFLTQLMARAVCAVHWPNPLIWVAAYRLRMERELACDDRVLNAGSRASDYAQHLLDVARLMRSGALTAVAGVAMARRSHLSDRLLAVLDETRRRASVTPGTALLGFVAVGAIVVAVAGAARGVEAVAQERPAATASPVPADPGLRPEAQGPERMTSGRLDLGARALQVATKVDTETLCDWSAQVSNTSTSSNIDDDKMRVRIKRGDCRLDIDSRGDFQLNEVETDVMILSPGGYFEIEERSGQLRRKLEIRAGRDGSVTRRWLVDGDERPYGADSRAWLTAILPFVYRVTGIDAEQRAARILAERGVDGLLTEIALISSDYVARRYYEVLVTEGDLSPADVRRVVRQAGAEIGSDFELTTLLRAIAESDLMDDSVVLAYVEAAGTIGSDHEQRRALDAVLARPTLSSEAAGAMLKLASDISSDFELAELLIEIATKHPIERSMTPNYFEAARTIGSDFELRRVLGVVLTQGAPDIDVLDRVLAAATTIGSDFELAELLISVSALYPLDRSVPPSYMTAANTIDSDHEMGRVLRALVQRGNLSPDALEAALRAARTIDSDFEAASLMLEVTARYELSAGARSVFFEVLRSINSDYEHARVLHGLLKEQSLTEALVADLLTSATEIGSDSELAGVLVTLAQRFPIGDRLNAPFMRTVDSIGSAYERDRVLAALRSSEIR